MVGNNKSGESGAAGIPWKGPANSVISGAAGAGLMAGLNNADPIAIIGSVAAWALVTLGALAGSAVGLWVRGIVIHSREYNRQEAIQTARIAELLEEKRRREEELIRERRDHEAEMRAAWLVREGELKERCDTWERRFWQQTSIMGRSTQQSADLAEANGQLVERIAQIVPLDRLHDEAPNERATATDPAARAGGTRQGGRRDTEGQAG